MKPNLREARERLRKDFVPAWYQGWAHFWFTTLWSLSLIALSWSRVVEPTLPELALVPVSFLVANLVEYLAHRFPMHHRTPGLGLLFDRHTLIHHQFYTHEAMATESSRDFKMILFPANVSVFFVVGLSGPLSLALYALASTNAAFLFFGTTVAYYLSYEWLHWSYHQPAGHWVARVPGMAALSRHHTVHHDPRLMTRFHFNITFPIFDVVFRTRKSTT